MTETLQDVVGIGNAIVDVLAHADDCFLAEQGLDKGAMTLIDNVRAEQLYGLMDTAIECSGGSAANTMAGLASFGGKGAFVGKVRDDQLGAIFAHDIRAIGIEFNCPPARQGPPTARSFIMVTPDAQRTMNTYLGACVELGPEDIDEATIANAKITYLEGYLWDRPEAKDAFRKALSIAQAHGRRVALTLSDAFCVDRHREEFRQLVADHVDILFANESEITALYEVADFDAALQAVRLRCQFAALTRGPAGSVLVSGEEVHVIDAWPVANPVDTTGAGDLYAAGVLFGLTHDHGLAASGRLGSLAAGEIISHYGARPETSLAELAQRSGMG
jgi:sugar/nucleoside kinase (ribokinase family)